MSWKSTKSKIDKKEALERRKELYAKKKEIWEAALDKIDKNAIAEGFVTGFKLKLFNPNDVFHFLTFFHDSYEFTIRRESLKHKAARLTQKQDQAQHQQQANNNAILDALIRGDIPLG